MNLLDNYIQWTPGMKLEAIEEKVITMAMRYFKGNKTSAAKSLGISERTLYYKIEGYSVATKKKEDIQLEQQKKREEFLKKQRGNVDAINAAANVSYKLKDTQIKPVPSVGEELTLEEKNYVKPADKKETIEEHSMDTAPRDEVEPTSKITPESPVSVSVGKEVQKVLPKKSSKRNTGKRGKNIPRANKK